MELKQDVTKFEENQLVLLEEIVRSISTKLLEAGIDGLKMEEITANIAFSVASIIDDTTHMESDSGDVKPYLAFRSGDDELIHCGENAYTYEFVIPVLKKLFDV